MRCYWRRWSKVKWGGGSFPYPLPLNHLSIHWPGYLFSYRHRHVNSVIWPKDLNHTTDKMFINLSYLNSVSCFILQNSTSKDFNSSFWWNNIYYNIYQVPISWFILKNQFIAVEAQLTISAKSVDLSKSTSANSSAVSLLFIFYLFVCILFIHTIWAILSCLLWLLRQNSRRVGAPALAFPWRNMEGWGGVPCPWQVRECQCFTAKLWSSIIPSKFLFCSCEQLICFLCALHSKKIVYIDDTLKY